MSKKLNQKFPERTFLICDRKYFKEELFKRLKLGEDLLKIEINNVQDLEKLKSDFIDWNDYNSEFLKSSFNNIKNEYRYRYDNCDNGLGLMDFFDKNKNYDPISDERKRIQIKLDNIMQLIAKTDLIPVEVDKSIRDSFVNDDLEKNIFIIHGHDTKSLLELETILRRDFGLNPFVLKDLPTIGSLTIIEKFEHYAQKCSFAIALFTPDDVIEKDGIKYLQARPNVIYELGWFCGKLSRKNVILILKEGTDIFSDFQGIVQIRFKNEIVEKYRDLMQELKVKNLVK